ncbi:hypothetical protein [Komagataeibacter medellinensis]|uniref:hypothetical protein n=1 Tax=Komagataeibacter medellinensis TaxID=1177712 RepID=UPI001E578A5E|nr:hypothetical protein [Komagataeibacter medellinensis]
MKGHIGADADPVPGRERMALSTHARVVAVEAAGCAPVFAAPVGQFGAAEQYTPVRASASGWPVSGFCRAIITHRLAEQVATDRGFGFHA